MQAMGESFARPFDLLLGRKTYEIFAAHWPYHEGEIADPFNAATKYVATSSAEPLAWENSVGLEGDVPAAVARLKEGDGPDLLTQGSACWSARCSRPGWSTSSSCSSSRWCWARARRCSARTRRPANGRSPTAAPRRPA